MAHFAEIGPDSTVLRVIVADTKEWCENNLGGTWVQTSYNTRGGIHYGQDGQPSGREPLHKNYAGIGYTWDGTGFAAPQPYPSWSMNQDSYLWEAPVPYPNDDKRYSWDEATTSWVELETV